jgi:hypothetical protein
VAVSPGGEVVLDEEHVRDPSEVRAGRDILNGGRERELEFGEGHLCRYAGVAVRSTM